MTEKRYDDGRLRDTTTGKFAEDRKDPAADSITGRAPEPVLLPYVIIEGGLVQAGEEGRVVIDLDILDDFVGDDELEDHVDHLVWIGDQLAAREMNGWLEQVEDRIRELKPDIIREPVAAIPAGTGPQTLVMEGGVVHETFNADDLLIVDLDELMGGITDDRRREMLNDLHAAGGADGDAYESIRRSAERYIAPHDEVLNAPCTVPAQSHLTWGQFLEEIDPVETSVRVPLWGPLENFTAVKQTRTYSGQIGGERNIGWVEVPAEVAAASRLKSTDAEVEAA